MMIGRSLDLSRNHEHVELGPVALRVEGLSCGELFQEATFEVREGEVLGFYGLVGAGRTEIAETLFGLRKPTAGRIMLKGEEVSIASPIDAIAKGHLAGAREPQGTGPRARHELPRQHHPAAGRRPQGRALRVRRGGNLDLRPVSRPPADQGAQLAHRP
jgi:ABC-type sugar transport system ATPase subunit